MHNSAQYWIEKLKLSKHPEGGYFREVYRSDEFISKKHLPGRYSSFRSFSTSIYFLLKSDEFSAFHRLKSDEIWHFYDGSPLLLYVIDPKGKLTTIKTGPNPGNNEMLQVVIPKGFWFAAEVSVKDSFSLIGCTVSPGFDFEDFELAGREKLTAKFPQHKELIERLTILV
jgi:predicted cupin superfamily sugar epimerase